MKIFVKALNGIHFPIDVNPEETVANLKMNIEAAQPDAYPATQLTLVYQGRVLNDHTTLEENRVAENCFIVVMVTKAPQTSAAALASTPASAIPPAPVAVPSPEPPQTGATPSAATPALTIPPAPVAAPSPAPALAPTPSVNATSETDVYGQVASNALSNLEGSIQQILHIGGGTWDRESVVRALWATNFNPQRAVEYLYSGIPEAPHVARSPTGTQVANAPTGQNPSVQPLQAASVPSNGPNANPLDLSPQGFPSNGSTNSAGANPLDYLRDNQQFQTFRAVVQANPHFLQPMLQQLGNEHPNLLRFIQEHQAYFLRLINEPLEGGESNILEQLDGAIPQAIEVSPDERDAMDRIEAMGFDRTLVREVFLACNKNEQQAANYLLDLSHD